MTAFSELQGETCYKIDGLEDNSDKVIFHCNSGKTFMMYHEPDWCEVVQIGDLDGDVEDMLNTPILMAEETDGESGEYGMCESYTWTFYKLRTIKGSMTIRWLGESNGYYCEVPYFTELKEK